MTTIDDLAERGAEALWRAFNADRPLPPELRPDHLRAARAVLQEALPVLANHLRQEAYKVERATRDYGPAVHPDLAGDLIDDLMDNR